jgi:hypothetical protein
VGVRLELTAHAAGVVLPGNPSYRFDQGWISVSDGGAMLQERRVSQDVREWFPAEMQLATTLGYSLMPGAVLNVTELKPAA